MKNKTILGLWFMALAGCHTVVKENIGLEDLHYHSDFLFKAVKDSAHATFNSFPKFATNVTRVGMHHIAKATMKAANFIANRAADIAHSTEN